MANGGAFIRWFAFAVPSLLPLAAYWSLVSKGMPRHLSDIYSSFRPPGYPGRTCCTRSGPENGLASSPCQFANDGIDKEFVHSELRDFVSHACCPRPSRAARGARPAP